MQIPVESWKDNLKSPSNSVVDDMIFARKSLRPNNIAVTLCLSMQQRHAYNAEDSVVLLSMICYFLQASFNK